MTTDRRAAIPDLGQPCCAIEGWTRLLSFVPGDFAVVIHAEPDCANLVLRDSRAADPGRFFCSNLTEPDAIAGRSRTRLAAAVRAAAARRRPGVVFVVGGCVAGLLADDVAAVAAAAGLPPDVKVIGIDGGAFSLHGQAELIDRFTGLLVESAARRRRPVPRSVGLVGFPPDDGEAEALLGRVGVAVHARPQLDAAPAAWEALAAVSLAVVSDGALFARLADALDRRHRVPCIEAPPPYGAAATERLYANVVLRLAGERSGPAAWRRERAAARRAVAAFRRRRGGLRLAYHVGGRKDFELHTLVHGGLAFLPAFLELGFDVELLFQGAVEDARRRRIEELLRRRAIALPYRCLPDRLSLTGALRDGRFDAVYCSDSLREEAGAAGVPIVPIGGLRPGFRGAAANCAAIDAVLGSR